VSKVHRRILPAKEPRCHPSPDCPLQDSCARFTCGLPQGIGATMANYRARVISGITAHLCPEFISSMVSDAELEAAAKPATKPPIGSKA
jgi:hypothetical protein